jgi:hypothetical protein
MAWGGKVGRMSIKVRNQFLRTSNRRLPAKENPLGVPRAVMKILQQQTLAGDQRPYDLRLRQLLALDQFEGG